MLNNGWLDRLFYVSEKWWVVFTGKCITAQWILKSNVKIMLKFILKKKLSPREWTARRGFVENFSRWKKSRRKGLFGGCWLNNTKIHESCWLVANQSVEVKTEKNKKHLHPIWRRKDLVNMNIQTRFAGVINKSPEAESGPKSGKRSIKKPRHPDGMGHTYQMVRRIFVASVSHPFMNFASHYQFLFSSRGFLLSKPRTPNIDLSLSHASIPQQKTFPNCWYSYSSPSQPHWAKRSETLTEVRCDSNGLFWGRYRQTFPSVRNFAKGPDQS